MSDGGSDIVRFNRLRHPRVKKVDLSSSLTQGESDVPMYYLLVTPASSVLKRSRRREGRVSQGAMGDVVLEVYKN